MPPRQPSQIIVLRHGEKQDAYRLCEVGVQRSLALAAQYLGKGAKDSLFPKGRAPDAFIAITLHTLELVSPAAQSWGKPVILYSALPMHGQTDEQATAILNRRTQEAARDVMTGAQWAGKTVVMVWEHHHIAERRAREAVSRREGDAAAIAQSRRQQGGAGNLASATTSTTSGSSTTPRDQAAPPASRRASRCSPRRSTRCRRTTGARRRAIRRTASARGRTAGRRNLSRTTNTGKIAERANLSIKIRSLVGISYRLTGLSPDRTSRQMRRERTLPTRRHDDRRKQAAVKFRRTRAGASCASRRETDWLADASRPQRCAALVDEF